MKDIKVYNVSSRFPKPGEQLEHVEQEIIVADSMNYNFIIDKK